MPTIDIDYIDFEDMLGIRLGKNREKIDELLALAKGELKLLDDRTGAMSVEIKDTNRPDLWNVEGLVRTIRNLLDLKKARREYKAGKSLAEVYVDKRLKSIRPYIACSIVKDAELNDTRIRALMQLQDKLDHTYGRNRRRTSIGLYDFDLTKPPFKYSVAKPTEFSFVPLGFERKLTLKQILREHPKGIEYASIVDKSPVYPILLDREKQVLSFPPIVNSNNLGRITERTHNILVEVTGTVHETVLNTLKIVTMSLIERGGKAHSANINYEDGGTTERTPDFSRTEMWLDIDFASKILDLPLKKQQIAGLLEKADFTIRRVEADRILVGIPSYRIDIMHPVDLVEDIAIAYGYGNIKPLWRKLPTIGAARRIQVFLDSARELMMGLGFQEILSYTLTNQDNLFTSMNLRKQRIVELANPKMVTLTCLRNWLLPSLMEFLACNMHVEYPHKIFELGPVTTLDSSAETRTVDEDVLAAALAHPAASFTEVKATLDALLSNLGMEWRTFESRHPSFIEGRVGTIEVEKAEVGVIGEIHPKVLGSWKLENPVAAFEINMNKLEKIRRQQQAKERNT